MYFYSGLPTTRGLNPEKRGYIAVVSQVSWLRCHVMRKIKGFPLKEPFRFSDISPTLDILVCDNTSFERFLVIPFS